MKKQHLITCPIFARELAAVLAQSPAAPLVRLMDYRVHFSGAAMAREVAKGVEAARQEGAAIALLVGRECESVPSISDMAAGCGGKLADGLNCIEIILGRERARQLQENRSTVMTPAWIEMINNSIADGHWTLEDARINLGRYDRIILLDFGLEPLDDEKILEFFELTQVPIEILPVSLDHFKQEVDRLLAAAER